MRYVEFALQILFQLCIFLGEIPRVLDLRRVLEIGEQGSNLLRIRGILRRRAVLPLGFLLDVFFGSARNDGLDLLFRCCLPFFREFGLGRNR